MQVAFGAFAGCGFALPVRSLWWMEISTCDRVGSVYSHSDTQLWVAQQPSAWFRPGDLYRRDSTCL